MLRRFLETLGIIWLCIEIGTFIEQRVPMLGNNTLFWPLWLSVFALLIAVVYILEIHLIPNG